MAEAPWWATATPSLNRPGGVPTSPITRTWTYSWLSLGQMVWKRYASGSAKPLLASTQARCRSW
jgi:hypothetical protein